MRINQAPRKRHLVQMIVDGSREDVQTGQGLSEKINDVYEKKELKWIHPSAPLPPRPRLRQAPRRRYESRHGA